MEKQNKETNVNKSSVLLQQMEVLKRNRDALAKRNINAANLSANNDRPKKVRRLNEGSGSDKSPNYQRILSTKDTKANNPKLQQKCSFYNEMISHGETFYEHPKKVHGPKKPDFEIKRSYTDSRGDNLKSHVEEVHGRKKPDNEIKSSYTNSRGDNLRSHVEDDTKANSSALQQKCPVCNKMISLGENLISHIDKVHGRNKLASEIKRPYTDSRGENLKSKVEEANGSNKPDSEIKKPDTDDSREDNLKSKVEEADSRGESSKSHTEKVHGSKNHDSKAKKPYTDSLEGNLKFHIEKVRGSEIKRSYTDNRGESSKSHVEEVHGSKNPDGEVKKPYTDSFGGNLKTGVEKVRGMKTSVPLNNKRKSPVHEAKEPVGKNEISTSKENDENSAENGETSEVGDDEIPDFENEPEGTNFRGNLKSHIEKATFRFVIFFQSGHLKIIDLS